jgi:hypothetical protein
MIRRQGMQDARWKLPRFAAACIVLLALALSLQAGASGDAKGHVRSLAVFAAHASVEIDGHHATTGHGGAEHCPSGPSCGSAVALPEAAGLQIGKRAPALIEADHLLHQRTIRPPLQPPNSAVQA